MGMKYTFAVSAAGEDEATIAWTQEFKANWVT